MSTPVPQVLLRKANGIIKTGHDQANMRSRNKGNLSDAGNSPKPAKGKAAADRRGASQNTQEAGAALTQTKTPRTKSHDEGEKLVIRRLPPGMTQEEFVFILGPDWEPSKGKVDWFSYLPGKTSTDPSKPSRPSRAYLHVLRKDDIMPLNEVVRGSKWEDEKSTFTDPALIGPPSLEFSVYKKVAGSKRRTDARQGTIDQDPEFMAFLEDLANPAPTRDSIDVDDTTDKAKTEPKTAITPLVEYLREKRANKGKDASGKGSKAANGGKGKSGSRDEQSALGRKKGKGDKTERSPKETVKILTKRAATDQAVEAAKNAASQLTNAAAAASVAQPQTVTTATATAATTATSADAPKRRRAGIAAAARILQRDLGLSPGSAHRRARQDAAKSDADVQQAAAVVGKEENSPVSSAMPATTVAASTDAPAAGAGKGRPESPVTVTSKAQGGRRNRGVKNSEKSKASMANEATTAAPSTGTGPTVILRKKKTIEDLKQKPPEVSSTSEPTTTGMTARNGDRVASQEKGNSKQASQQKRAAAPVSANATQAFVKHAGGSHGVNDASLREVLGAFGAISLIEIDKRRGFAFVDFAHHDGLSKAIAASPLPIGQTSIQVSERRDKKSAPASGASSGKDGASASASTSGGKDKDKSSGGGGRGRRHRGGGKAAASGVANGQAVGG